MGVEARAEAEAIAEAEAEATVEAETEAAVEARAETEAAADAYHQPVQVPDIRLEPWPLPAGYEWCTMDMHADKDARDVFELLVGHYVESDDAVFRFAYSIPFLQWALCPPGYVKDWHVGLRATTAPGQPLLAFISGIPMDAQVWGRPLRTCEINFLCVHKRLRNRRLTPVLIKEVTRRVNVHGVFQAVYTAGVDLCSSLASCRYYHRDLNCRKLVDIGFADLGPRMTMRRYEKLHPVRKHPVTPGLRPLELADVPVVTGLLNTYLSKFQLRQTFTEECVRHWFMSRPGVVQCFVVPNDDGVVTDVVSFYVIDSTVHKVPRHTTLRAAHGFYVVANTCTLTQLYEDAFALAAAQGADVFNVMDTMDNAPEVLMAAPLRFKPGNGVLRYYVYNWRCPAMCPAQIGMTFV